MRATIEAIARDLTQDGLVLRYRNEQGLNADGLSGEEGTFVICSFWLVSALAKAGEVDRLIGFLDSSKARAERQLGRTLQIVLCYEVGYDGFWLARLLMARGIHTIVFDPASGLHLLNRVVVFACEH